MGLSLTTSSCSIIVFIWFDYGTIEVCVENSSLGTADIVVCGTGSEEVIAMVSVLVACVVVVVVVVVAWFFMGSERTGIGL